MREDISAEEVGCKRHVRARVPSVSSMTGSARELVLIRKAVARSEQAPRR